jgi:hypothetical protein
VYNGSGAAVVEFGHSHEATLSPRLTRFNAAIWLGRKKAVVKKSSLDSLISPEFFPTSLRESDRIK